MSWKPNYLTADYFRRCQIKEIDKIINYITLGLMSALISLHLFMDPVKHWDEKFMCILLFITCKVRRMLPPTEKPQCSLLEKRGCNLGHTRQLHFCNRFYMSKNFSLKYFTKTQNYKLKHHVEAKSKIN